MRINYERRAPLQKKNDFLDAPYGPGATSPMEYSDTVGAAGCSWADRSLHGALHHAALN